MASKFSKAGGQAGQQAVEQDALLRDFGDDLTEGEKMALEFKWVASQLIRTAEPADQDELQLEIAARAEDIKEAYNMRLVS